MSAVINSITYITKLLHDEGLPQRRVKFDDFFRTQPIRKYEGDRNWKRATLHVESAR
jgi:hypothetical protein